MGHGLAVFSRPKIDNPEVVMTENVLRFHLESAAESLDGAVHVILAQVGDAEIVEWRCYAWIEFDRAQVAANRVVELAHSIVNRAKQVMNVGPGRIDSYRLIEL